MGQTSARVPLLRVESENETLEFLRMTGHFLESGLRFKNLHHVLSRAYDRKKHYCSEDILVNLLNWIEVP